MGISNSSLGLNSELETTINDLIHSYYFRAGSSKIKQPTEFHPLALQNRKVGPNVYVTSLMFYNKFMAVLGSNYRYPESQNSFLPTNFHSEGTVL